MKLKTLFIFLTLVCYIYADSSSSSEESSEEKDYEVNKDDEALFDDCENRCVQQQLRNNNAYTKALTVACREGCEAQDDIFGLYKMEHPSTDPSRLLGAAVDKCWDSCLRQDLAKAQFCISGCSAMKEIQAAKEERNKEEEDGSYLLEGDEEIKDDYVKDSSENNEEEEDEEYEEDNEIDGETYERNSILDNEDYEQKEKNAVEEKKCYPGNKCRGNK